MTFKKANNLLLIIIILINGTVIVTPFIPVAAYTVAKHSGTQQKLQTSLDNPVKQPDQPNHLIAPSMLLDQQVYDGTDIYATLNKGILRWPASSTPDKGGNTVLLGHRFTYHIPKGVFYYLDKLQPGDEIGLVWNNRLYHYRVTTSRSVDPSDTSIVANTADSRLTLYTCTPLYWPKERLVVTALMEPAYE